MNTYATHQVPLLLEQWIGEDVVRAGVPVRHPATTGHQRPEAREAHKVLIERAVVTLEARLLMLLLHPPDLRSVITGQRLACGLLFYQSRGPGWDETTYLGLGVECIVMHLAAVERSLSHVVMMEQIVAFQ